MSLRSAADRAPANARVSTTDPKILTCLFMAFLLSYAPLAGRAVVVGICVSEAMATIARHVLDAKAAAASALWHGFNL